METPDVKTADVKTALVSGMSLGFEFIHAIWKAATNRGGTDECFKLIRTEPELAVKIAELLVPVDQPTHEEWKRRAFVARYQSMLNLKLLLAGYDETGFKASLGWITNTAERLAATGMANPEKVSDSLRHQLEDKIRDVQHILRTHYQGNEMLRRNFFAPLHDLNEYVKVKDYRAVGYTVNVLYARHVAVLDTISHALGTL